MTYTKKEVEKMVDLYTDNPCLEVVDKLSVLLNKPRKSVIAKLVKEGVYLRRGYRSKTGEIPITKLDLVHDIEDALDTKLPGLDKAPKITLKELRTTVIDSVQLLEDSLEELKNASGLNETYQDLLKVARGK